MSKTQSAHRPFYSGHKTTNQITIMQGRKKGKGHKNMTQGFKERRNYIRLVSGIVSRKTPREIFIV